MAALVKVENFFNRIAAKRRDSFLFGLLVFLFFYVSGVCLFWLPSMIEKGSVMSGDGISIYYPSVLMVRRSLIEFFDSVAAGEPVLPMMDFAHMFGSDIFAGPATFCYALLPYYLLSVFVEESSLPFFYSCEVVVFWLISGISFLYMCRYFKQNMLLSGFFAFFYIFCGNMFYTSMWNVHFCVMFATFPLLIAGMDKIINGKRALCFIFSISWLIMSGYPFLVYTLPFVALFALIRIRYVKDGNYALNVLKYLVIGIGHIVLGLLVAGVFFIPALYQTIQSGRSLIGDGISFWELFIPSTRYMKNFFNTNFTTAGGVSNSGAVLPALLFVLFSYKAKSEHKMYVVIMLACVAMPLVWYGLNGFSYDMCRWGVAPSILSAFMGVLYLPKMLKADKRELRAYIVYALLLVIGCVTGMYVFVMIELFALGIIGVFPKLEEKVWGFFCRVCKAVADFIAKVKASRYRVLRLPVYIAIAAGIIVLLTLDYGYDLMELSPSLLIATGASMIIMAIAYCKPSVQAVSSVSLVVLYIVSSAFYYTTVGGTTFNISLDRNMFHALAELDVDNDMMNRVSNMYDSYYFTGYLEDFDEEEETEDTTETTDETMNDMMENFGESGILTDPNLINQMFGTNFVAAENGVNVYEDENKSGLFKIYHERIADDPYFNQSLRYGLKIARGLQSTIDKNFVKLLNRCEQDVISYSSKIQIDGFYTKEVLYSLFGVNYLYSFFDSEDRLYGIEQVETSDPLLKNVYLYRNKYALPVGSTYDTVMSKEYFDSLGAAELPYAMFNSAYLEGYEGNLPVSDKHVAKVCDTELTRNVFLVSAFGNEMANNSIKINDDVSGCMLYISIADVDYTSGLADNALDVRFVVDRERYVGMLIETQLWQWKRGVTDYTVNLGYCENDVDEISFLSLFDFNTDKLVVTAIPVENYTGAYEKRTAETLRNVKMGQNKITGHIDVSSEKILSVPMIYSAGWKAYIDGVETKVYKLNDIFLGVPLSAGSHDVVFKYTTPYIVEGLWISIGALIVTIGYIVFFAVKKKKCEKTVVNDENE